MKMGVDKVWEASLCEGPTSSRTLLQVYPLLVPSLSHSEMSPAQVTHLSGGRARPRSQPLASVHPSALTWGTFHLGPQGPPAPAYSPLTSFSPGASASSSGPSGFACRDWRVSSSSLEVLNKGCSSFHESCRARALWRSSSCSLSCLTSRDPRALGRPP